MEMKWFEKVRVLSLVNIPQPGAGAKARDLG